jgi:hypothetical protein
MKFEFNEEKSTNVGLVMSTGTIGNTVFFWDENEEAAEYVIELYRSPISKKYNGFIFPSEVQEREVSTSEYSDTRRRFVDVKVKNTSINRTIGIVGDKLTTTRTWEDTNSGNYRGKVQRSEVTYNEFSEVKPVCVEIIERNRFYKSFNDLAKGSYIAILKLMNRGGEEISRSYPYYFTIDVDDIVGKLAPIIRSVGPNVVCN